jgi:glycosyltransferase involved in cell wall biosynthesis
MTQPRSASIVITCYNYARFLPESIKSALAQTHPDTEVVVVDDGSTDESRDVIARYGDRVTPVLKPNGGMASAFNHGYAVASGDVIVFLDADDTIYPEAVARDGGTCRSGHLEGTLEVADSDGGGRAYWYHLSAGRMIGREPSRQCNRSGRARLCLECNEWKRLAQALPFEVDSDPGTRIS